MKKFYNHIAVALMAVLAMTTLSSCETDESIAYDLNGEWQGYLGESYYNYWGYEDYAEYYTVMRFYRDGYSSYSYGATSGQGEQIDYQNGNRYRPYYRYFRWSVEYGTIYIDYNTGEHLRIYNFNINSRRFSGVMEYTDYYGRSLYSGAEFNFTKTDSFNWNYYYDWSQQPAGLVGDSIVIQK